MLSLGFLRKLGHERWYWTDLNLSDQVATGDIELDGISYIQNYGIVSGIDSDDKLPTHFLLDIATAIV